MPNSPEQLAYLIKNGDQAALRRLIEQYRQQAFAMAFRILCDEEEAKDAVQEGFIKIWERIALYDPAQKFTSWMNRIFLNCAIDRSRAMKREKLVRMDMIPEIMNILLSERGDTILENREIALLIRNIAGALPEKQRLVFLLRDIQGMESTEVEELLHLSDTSVKSNLFHARKAIGHKLNNMLKTEWRYP